MPTTSSKEFTEVLSVLKEIQAKINVGNVAGLRGPVGDPAPDWGANLIKQYQQFPFQRPIFWDPAPEFLLGKDKLARLRIHQIDSTVLQLQKEIEALNLQKVLLKEEYNLK